MGQIWKVRLQSINLLLLGQEIIWELYKENASKYALRSQDAFVQVWKGKLVSIGETDVEKANALTANFLHS